MEQRRPLIAGNWKMFKTPAEAVDAASTLAGLVADAPVDVMIAPTFVGLESVHSAIKDTDVILSAQNMYWEAEGAFTGEISAGMLKACGVTHVIIGHSERRQYFGETDETVNKKVLAALAAGLSPVVCVGETKAERDAQKTLNVLDKQVREGLKEVSLEGGKSPELVVAYEPVWAIGTGETATSKQAQEAHAYIRGLLSDLLGNSLAKTIRLLYGGSVKPANATELMSMPDIDGALVGGASLDPETFAKIVHFG